MKKKLSFTLTTSLSSIHSPKQNMASIRVLRQLTSTSTSGRAFASRLPTRTLVTLGARPSHSVLPHTPITAVRGFAVSARRFGEGTS
jgi:hypothetical protein